MRVLVATDLSAPADEAIRQAHAWAGDSGALAVCHVLPNLQPVAPLFPQRTQETIVDVGAFSTRAGEAVAGRVSELTGRAANEFEVFVDQGVDYAEIARRAATWKADLVVVGSHGFTGLMRLLLGSVAERVARYSPCPCLVARAGPTSGPIVAATDLSDPSLPAIVAAQAEALRRSAALIVVHALDYGSLFPFVAGLPFGFVPLGFSSDARAEIEAAAKTSLVAAMKSIGADGEPRVVAGDPGASIVREAESAGAQLVVVGTHGRTGLSQIALGSVAERVMRAAPSSVLVVRLASA